MANIKTASLIVKGNLLAKIIKDETVNPETGIVIPEHLQLQFIMLTHKGVEFLKVKDIDSKFKDLVEGQDCEIPVRVTASNMGQTYYEVC